MDCKRKERLADWGSLFSVPAGVAKLVDAQDLKSWVVNNDVPVRFRSSAPCKEKPKSSEASHAGAANNGPRWGIGLVRAIIHVIWQAIFGAEIIHIVEDF